MTAGGLTMDGMFDKEIGSPSPHLTELERLVSGGLPEVQEGSGRLPGFVNWPVERGTAMSWDMPTHLGQSVCALAETMLTKGTVFPYHDHASAGAKETLICVKGIILVRFHGESETVLMPGDSILIEPSQVHSVEAPEEDAWVVAVTVPRDPGFPG